MSKKSVVILGKGPSVKRCTREFIDSFDEVVACGRPVFLGYEEYIGERSHHDFANRTSTPYSSEEIERLGIKTHVDTGDGTPLREKFSYGELDPSTGILAFDHFVNHPEYDEIAVIGFDLFVTGGKMYYHKNEEFDPAVQWLWEDGTYDEEGRLTIVSGHKTELMFEYLNAMFDKFQDKIFYVISFQEFESKENVVIL